VGLPSPGRTARLSFTTTLDHNRPFFPDFVFGRAAAGAPGSDWTGLYLGGHLGYAFSNIKGVTTATDGTSNAVTQTESANINLADLARGGQIGFNYQFDNRVVIGVEGDVSWTKLYGVQESRATESAALAAAGWLQAKTTYQQDWIATLRGRVGYAFDRMFIYGTAGLAFLSEREVRSQYRSDIGSGSLPFGRSTAEIFKENVTKTRQGWTVGTGLEYALMNNWSLKGEYAYAGFDAEEFEFPGARSGVSLPFTERVRCRAGNTTPPCRGLNEFVTVASSDGSSTKVNGRHALNSLGLHTIKIGMNYRF
jgi:hemoglobin/transferrin/lactoferrin receptor protein